METIIKLYKNEKKRVCKRMNEIMHKNIIFNGFNEFAFI
jgi:hypothetical protein